MFKNLRKNTAFTMAEILLSLTIIGVVAAITLPSLTGNINEKSWNTQKKALFARMALAFPLLESINSFDGAEAFIAGGLNSVIKVNNVCTGNNIEDCGFKSKSLKALDGSVLEVFPFGWTGLGVTNSLAGSASAGITGSGSSGYSSSGGYSSGGYSSGGYGSNSSMTPEDYGGCIAPDYGYSSSYGGYSSSYGGYSSSYGGYSSSYGGYSSSYGGYSSSYNSGYWDPSYSVNYSGSQIIYDSMLGKAVNVSDSTMAAFETTNGESVVLWYNSKCKSDQNIRPINGAYEEWYQYVCVNMVYDLNKKKGPNSVGKDIGFITVFYPTDSILVSPAPNLKDANYTGVCADGLRVPNKYEAASLALNERFMTGEDAGTIPYFTSTRAATSTTAYKVYVSGGHFVGTTSSPSSSTARTRCVKR